MRAPGALCCPQERRAWRACGHPERGRSRGAARSRLRTGWRHAGCAAGRTGCLRAQRSSRMRAPSSMRSPQRAAPPFSGAGRRTSARCWSICTARAARTARNPVQVMTIHRAKGLEFDHVFVPALERNPPLARAAPAALDRPAARRAASSDLLIAPAPAVQAHEEAATLDERLGSVRARPATPHERARLLYVAATRARRRCGCPARRRGGATDARRAARTLCWRACGRCWPSASSARRPGAADAAHADGRSCCA